MDRFYKPAILTQVPPQLLSACIRICIVAKSVQMPAQALIYEQTEKNLLQTADATKSLYLAILESCEGIAL